MASHDLDLDNYNLVDLLNLFHLKYDFDEADLKKARQIVYKMHPDKSSIDNKYFIFFNKAYKTVEKVYYFKKKKHQDAHNVEYSYLNDNVKKDEKLLAQRLKGKSVKDFNIWFNQMFEKVKMKEDASNSGYEKWFRSDEDVNDQKASSLNDFDRLFHDKKNACRELVVKKDLEEMTSQGGYNLNRNKPEHYSSGVFSKLAYEDLKKAHTETVVPVTEEDFLSKEKYKNVDALSRAREQQDVTAISLAQSNRLLDERRRKETIMTTNTAYNLLKQDEEVRRMNEKWWRHFKQLDNN